MNEQRSHLMEHLQYSLHTEFWFGVSLKDLVMFNISKNSFLLVGFTIAHTPVFKLLWGTNVDYLVHFQSNSN